MCALDVYIDLMGVERNVARFDANVWFIRDDISFWYTFFFILEEFKAFILLDKHVYVFGTNFMNLNNSMLENQCTSCKKNIMQTR